jgi:hypothetical protein
MAGIAGEAGVLPVQRETGRCPMIELRSVKKHNVKIFAVVIAMAIGARSVRHMCMNSPRGVHASLDFLVATETLLVRESLPVGMAGCAFVDSFQRLMHAGEFAGRNLCLHGKRNKDSEYEQNPACNHLPTPHIAKENGGGNMNKKNGQQDYRKRDVNNMPVLENTTKLFKKEHPAVQDGPPSGDAHAC